MLEPALADHVLRDRVDAAARVLRRDDHESARSQHLERQDGRARGEAGDADQQVDPIGQPRARLPGPFRALLDQVVEVIAGRLLVGDALAVLLRADRDLVHAPDMLIKERAASLATMPHPSAGVTTHHTK